MNLPVFIFKDWRPSFYIERKLPPEKRDGGSRFRLLRVPSLAFGSGVSLSLETRRRACYDRERVTWPLRKKGRAGCYF